MSIHYQSEYVIIPTEIGLLTQLTCLRMYKTTSLILYQNQMSGTIPTEIGWLTQLTAIGLMSHQLTGTIPSTLGNMIEFTHLFLACQLTDSDHSNVLLHSNQLIGTIESTMVLLLW